MATCRRRPTVRRSPHSVCRGLRNGCSSQGQLQSGYAGSCCCAGALDVAHPPSSCPKTQIFFCGLNAWETLPPLRARSGLATSICKRGNVMDDVFTPADAMRADYFYEFHEIDADP